MAEATVTGAVQVAPPSLERLTTTVSPLSSGPATPRARETTIQTSCRASYATAGSLARCELPSDAPTLGRTPLSVQVAPESVENADPMPSAPPFEKRPT